MSESRPWRNPETLREYYESAPFVLPNEPQFRSFQFRFDDKTVTPLRHTIKNAEDLRYWALRFAPIAIYCSRAKYLQAKNLGAKGGELAKNIFLGGDLVVDLDFRDFASPAACEKSASVLYDYMRQRWPDCPAWFVFSGRGFHLWAFDWFKPDMSKSPGQRETAFLIRLSKTFKMLGAYGYVDMSHAVTQEQRRVYLNPRQIFRVPGSINHHNGKPVSIVRALSVNPGLYHPRNRALELSELKAMMNASPVEIKSRGFASKSDSIHNRRAERGDAPSNPAQPRPPESAGVNFRKLLIGGF
jgi:hypothetical protein